MNISNVQIEYKGFRENDPVRRLINTDKIKERTTWKEQISLDKGLDMCIQTKVTHG